jgi:hypothetical protein
MPKTQFQFPDDGILSVGTVSCEDQIHQAVYLSYTPAGSETPSMELELPPKTVEVIIRHLQERANEARFVNGEKMLDYPKPVPAKPPSAKPSRPRRKTSKKATDLPPADDAKPPATP